jgi:glycosyltransferase involved in cell wall biosynthesis
MKPVRIMHLITDLDVGGAEMMLSRLVAASNRDRFQMEVVSLIDPGPAREFINVQGVAIESLGMKRSIADPRGLARLVMLLRSRQVDILQTWLYHADFLGTIATYLAPVPRLLWNIRCSNMDPRHYSWQSAILLRLLARLSARPDVVLANSSAGKLFHERVGYNPPRWEIVPNGVDIEEFRPDPSLRSRLRNALHVPRASFVICLPARVDPMKDHATFLEAAARFAREHRDALFVLVGRGADHRNPILHSHIERSGCADRIVLLGERRDMAEILAGVDVVTLSSQFGEGFPNVLAEAMACGIPVVSTDVGDSAQIVGGTGLVVPIRNPDAIAKAWGHYYNLDAESRASIGRAARRRIADHYALPNVVAQYEALYEELVSRASA